MHYDTHIIINAPTAKVWDVLTNTTLLRRVLGADSITTDWRVGSPITFVYTWENAQHIDKGYIRSFESAQQLSLAYLPVLGELPDTPENYQNITYDLVDEDDQTVLRVRHDNIQDDFFAKRALELWGEILRGIKSISESK